MISISKNEKNRRISNVKLSIFLVYIAFLAFSAIWWAVNFDLRNLLMSVLFMGFVPLMLLAERLFRLDFGALFCASVLFIATGSILGSCFNVYTLIPFFDTLLHGISGIAFAAFGFSLAMRLFGTGEGERLFGCVAFAFCFSLAVAVLWELFEYGCTMLFGFDMMEDSYVGSISSYLLSGTHNETVTLDGITKTVIYYADGKTFTVNGYLDLGLIDTVADMAICTLGAAVFSLIALIRKIRFPKDTRA